MTGVQSFLNTERSDSRRLTMAILAALAIHLFLFAVLGIVRLAEHPAEAAPVSVDLLAGALAGLPAGAPGPASSGAASPGPIVQGGPAAPATARASRGGQPSGSGFVIPTPRQGAGGPTQPTGPSFREAGGRAGTQAGASQPATSPVQVPVFPPARTSGSEGTSPSGGAAAASPGNLGGGATRGVPVQGGGQQGAQGSLDPELGSLDKSLAGAKGQGGASGTGGGAAAGGGGGGGGGNGGGSGSFGGGGGGNQITWDQPDAAKSRRLLSTTSPKIPLWVSREGLTLKVLIDFTLTSEGILRDVRVEGSSGYNDVDTAVVEAIRLWRFNPDPGSRAIHGLIPYLIQAR